jgi:hypothetical protein
MTVLFLCRQSAGRNQRLEAAASANPSASPIS